MNTYGLNCEGETQTHAKHLALLRRLELEALAELARNGNARIYISFDKHIVTEAAKSEN